MRISPLLLRYATLNYIVWHLFAYSCQVQQLPHLYLLLFFQKIYYCASLLFDSTLDVTSHLQQLLNYASRVIFHLPRSSNIASHVKSLQWLPVRVRSTCKIACLCYHCRSNTAPSYVNDMLQKSHHTFASLAPALTPCLFSIDLHTVKRHLVTVRLILLLLSGTLFQMMSGVFHHCLKSVTVYVLFEEILVLFNLHRLNILLDHCSYVHGLALLLIC